MVTRINKRSLQKLLSGQVKAPTKCLIKFYSPTCHYCHALKQDYEYVSEEFPDVLFFAFNIEDYQDASKILNFEGVPTICKMEVGGTRPRIKVIPEPENPHKTTWYTRDDIRIFIGGEQ